MTLARLSRYDSEVWGDNKNTYQGPMELERVFAENRKAKARHTIPPSEDKDLMMARLSRENSMPLCFPHVVLFPEISCAGCISLVAPEHGLPCSNFLCVSHDPVFVEELAALSFAVSPPRDQVKILKPSGRPKKSDKRRWEEAMLCQAVSFKRCWCEGNLERVDGATSRTIGTLWRLDQSTKCFTDGKRLGMVYDCSDCLLSDCI